MSLFGDELPDTEDPVEIDSLSDEINSDALLEPQLMPYCLGHEAAEEKLVTMIEQNRLPHGLIFSGLKGIGKATFAHRLAKYLLSRGDKTGSNDLLGDIEPTQSHNLQSDPNHPQVRLYLSGAHPDCMMIGRTYDSGKNTYKDSVDVDEVRKVTPFLRMTSSYGGYRIVIIDDADTMNRNAQNAILKILEEPPKQTLIILIAHRIGQLIPTIRSRTQALSFNPLSKENTLNLLNKTDSLISDTEKNKLLDLSKGSIGYALDLLNEGGLEALGQALKTINHYPKWNWAEHHKTFDGLSRASNKTQYNLFTRMLSQVFYDLIHAKVGEADIPAYILEFEQAHKLYIEKDLNQLLEIHDSLNDHFQKIDRANLDKKQALIHALNLIAA